MADVKDLKSETLIGIRWGQLYALFPGVANSAYCDISILDDDRVAKPETHLAVRKELITRILDEQLSCLERDIVEESTIAFTTDDIVSLLYKGHDPREVLLQLAKREGSESAVINALRTHGH